MANLEREYEACVNAEPIRYSEEVPSHEGYTQASAGFTMDSLVDGDDSDSGFSEDSDPEVATYQESKDGKTPAEEDDETEEIPSTTPRVIEPMSTERAAQIQAEMAQLKLTPPPWATRLPEEKWLEDILNMAVADPTNVNFERALNSSSTVPTSRHPIATPSSTDTQNTKQSESKAKKRKRRKKAAKQKKQQNQIISNGSSPAVPPDDEFLGIAGRDNDTATVTQAMTPTLIDDGSWQPDFEQ